MRSVLWLSLVLSMAAFASGCSSESAAVDCPGVGCPCTGSTCSCPAGKTCAWEAAGSAKIMCSEGSDCTGTCGASCDPACEGSSTECTFTLGASASPKCKDATCALTAGASSSLECSGAATCTLTCTSTCNLACKDSATCRIQCASESSPRTITGDAKCE